ncbi:cation-transporting P-type ATPase [Streptomyces sp. NPDC042207]|uniref:cation-transporting P-type ATPase n=1 Tax=Streptomyces sp. NPDC042207 TaxID=3154331 RepID=UPI0033EB92AD
MRDQRTANDRQADACRSADAGLESAQAAARRECYGPNVIEVEERSVVLELLSHFWGPIPWMIEAALALTAATKRWADRGDRDRRRPGPGRPGLDIRAGVDDAPATSRTPLPPHRSLQYKTAGERGVGTLTCWTRGNRPRSYPETENRRSGTLCHRFQNSHALHVRRHRKVVGLSEPLKNPGQSRFLGSLSCLRAPRASNERHGRQPVPPEQGGTGYDSPRTGEPAPLTPGAGPRIMTRTGSPAAIMESCPPAHSIPHRHPHRGTSRALSPRTSRCTVRSSGDVCQGRWTSCTARPRGSWSCHCTWPGPG